MPRRVLLPSANALARVRETVIEYLPVVIGSLVPFTVFLGPLILGTLLPSPRFMSLSALIFLTCLATAFIGLACLSSFLCGAGTSLEQLATERVEGLSGRLSWPLRWLLSSLPRSFDWVSQMTWTAAGIMVLSGQVVVELHVAGVYEMVGLSYSPFSLVFLLVPAAALITGGVIDFRWKAQDELSQIRRGAPLVGVLLMFAALGFGQGVMVTIAGLGWGSEALIGLHSIGGGALQSLVYLVSEASTPYGLSGSDRLYEAMGPVGVTVLLLILPVVLGVTAFLGQQYLNRSGQAVRTRYSRTLYLPLLIPILLFVRIAAAEGWLGPAGESVAAMLDGGSAFFAWVFVTVSLLVLWLYNAAAFAFSWLASATHLMHGPEGAEALWGGIVIGGLVLLAIAVHRLRRQPTPLAVLALLAGAALFPVPIMDHLQYHGEAAERPGIPVRVYELVGAMNVRDGPSDQSELLATLQRGGRVLLGSQDDQGWARIYDPQGVPLGYVWAASPRIRPVLSR